jgi:prepilin-type processing-associated H-X9-DG protein
VAYYTTTQLMTIAKKPIPGFMCPSDPIGSINNKWTANAVSPATSAQIAKSNYVANNQTFGLNSYMSMRDILDGSSNTLMVGEKCLAYGFYGGIWIGLIKWGGGDGDFTSEPLFGNANGVASTGGAWRINWQGSDATEPKQHLKGNYSSVHTGGAQFLFADGKVAFLSENIGLQVFNALSTKAGNEIVGEY